MATDSDVKKGLFKIPGEEARLYDEDMITNEDIPKVEYVQNT